jgi:hypothetical protein
MAISESDAYRELGENHRLNLALAGRAICAEEKGAQEKGTGSLLSRVNYGAWPLFLNDSA